MKKKSILSLFDGISCGQQSLKNLGWDFEYYASEINKDSITVTKDRHPNTIHIGDVEELLRLDDEGNIVKIGDKLKNLPKIDILFGGSPCQGISQSKSTGKLNLKDERSKLFFNYIAIRDWLIENNNPDLIWLLENVVPNQETLKIMNEATRCSPIRINSKHFVAQDRDRLYWSNIKVDVEKLPPADKVIGDIMLDNHGESIKNIVEQGYEDTIRRGKNYIQWDTSGKGYYSQQNRARYQTVVMNTLTKSNHGDKTRIFLGEDENGVYYRNASVEELEILQGLPMGYTSSIRAKSKRRGLIGDGWTVPVIEWIVSHIGGEGIV